MPLVGILYMVAYSPASPENRKSTVENTQGIGNQRIYALSGRNKKGQTNET